MENSLQHSTLVLVNSWCIILLVDNNNLLKVEIIIAKGNDKLFTYCQAVDFDQDNGHLTAVNSGRVTTKRLYLYFIFCKLCWSRAIFKDIFIKRIMNDL